MDGHWCAPSALAILTDVESASMSGLFDVWMPRAMGALVARQKAKKTKAAKGRSRARRAEVQALRSAGSDSSMDESLIEALPKIDALQDVPSFGDMRVDQSQADAFKCLWTSFARRARMLWQALCAWALWLGWTAAFPWLLQRA